MIFPSGRRACSIASRFFRALPDSKNAYSDKRATELSKRERMLALKEINVPAEFADLIRDDADISKLSDLFRGVQGSYVPADHKDGGSTITKEDFSAMSYSKQAELYAQNPELYELLTK